MEISKIVITGGPCEGKSTAMSWVQNAFTQMGYMVLFVPETATELITGGVAPWTCGTNAEYQKCQLKLQIEKENIFEQAARTMEADKVLIVCDRGTLDNKAYMDDIEFAEAIQFIGSNEVELRDNYDAVFHLVNKDFLLHPEFTKMWCFGLKQPFFQQYPQRKEDILKEQFFTMSELCKMIDEAEWHFWNSHERVLSKSVWDEICDWRMKGEGMTFAIKYFDMIVEETGISKEDVGKLCGEQGTHLCKYKW